MANKTAAIKAYCTFADGEEEIRRFCIPEEVCTSFTYIKAKLKAVFEINSNNFKFYWQDPENDYIFINSDEELIEAITDSISGDHLLRFFVRVDPPSPQGPSDGDVKEKGMHFGVNCDGCQGLVKGFRYKCTTCNDFDLCADCEAKGIHPHHKMMRIPCPSKDTGFGEWVMDDDDDNIHSSGPQCHRRDKCRSQRKSGRWGHHARGRRWFGQSHGRPCMNNSFMGCNSSPVFEPSPNRSSWPGWYGNWNGFAGTGPQKPSGGFQWATSAGSNLPFMNFGAGTSGGANVNVNTETIRTETQKAAEEAAKHVTNIMKGIWTAWSGTEAPPEQKSDSDNSSQKAGSCSPKTNRTQDDGQNSPSSQGINIEIIKEQDGIRQRCSVDDGAAPKSVENEEQDQLETGSVANEPEIIDLSPSEELQAMEISAQDDDVPESRSSQDWCIVEEEKGATAVNTSELESAPPQGNPQTGSPNVLYPQLEVVEQPKKISSSNESPAPVLGEQPQKISSSNVSPALVLDPEVLKALYQMKAMGYTDEGGWLTQLCIMKKGNINAILDLLMPRPK